jgi:uncharacterized protein with HEPN domain
LTIYDPESIRRFVDGRNLDDLLPDDPLRPALYWKFFIIGEALTQIKKIDEPTFDKISASWRIVV